MDKIQKKSINPFFIVTLIILGGMAVWIVWRWAGPSKEKVLSEEDAFHSRPLTEPQPVKLKRENVTGPQSPLDVQKERPATGERRVIDQDHSVEETKLTARQLIAEGKLDEAIQVYEKTMMEHPNDPLLKKELALAHIENNQVDKAKELYERMINEDPNSSEGHLGLGIVDRLNGNFDSALAKMNEALRLDPNNADAKFNMAEMLAYENKGGGAAEKYLAERFYVDLLQSDPENVDLQNGLAAVHLQSGRVDQAIGVWEKMAVQVPAESVVHSNLSEAYITANRLDDAVTASQKALELDPNNSDAYFFLGAAEVAKGNVQDGLRAIQKAAEIDPTNMDYQKKLRELGLQ